MIKTISNIYRKKNENLKVSTDRKGGKLWFGHPPKLLKVEDLNACDVFFCGPGEKIKKSELIQGFTAGEYVHCAFYKGDGRVVDMIGSGIREQSLEEFLGCYSYIAVTQCPGSDEDREKQISYVERCQEKGLGYNKIGAALVPFKEYKNIKDAYSIIFGKPFRPREGAIKISEAKNLFCSEFILECFKAGDYIPDDNYYSSDLWSPNGLAEEGIFEFRGYMSEKGFEGVDAGDHFLEGNSWLLTEQGQKQQIELQEELKERVKEIIKQQNSSKM
ncbi:MAG: hypothetical protein HRU20_27685 [Pseudomonadales bacterium]|nr:hypothetical protein [Pseudomonadales bacterium]